MWGSRKPLLEFWEPLISRKRLTLATSNLARRLRQWVLTKGNGKLGQKGSCRGHVTHFWNFGTTLYLANGWSYQLQIWHGDGRPWVLTKENGKLGQKGSCRVHVTHFWNFAPPPFLISRDRLKLETSNLAMRGTAVSSNEKLRNWVKRGHVGIRWPNFGIFVPP